MPRTMMLLNSFEVSAISHWSVLCRCHMSCNSIQLSHLSNMSAHRRLHQHTQPYNRLWAFVSNNWADNHYHHFRMYSAGQYCHREASRHVTQCPSIPPCFWRRLLYVSHQVREPTITADCDVRLYGMCSTMITITKFNGTNYAQWATQMAELLEQNQVYGIIEEYDDKP